MRRFELWRNTDVNGMSGTGIVAEGVEFSDGTAAMRWKTDIATTSVAPNVNHFNYIHGHEGATRVVWIDERPEAGDEAILVDEDDRLYGDTFVVREWINGGSVAVVLSTVSGGTGRIKYSKLRKIEPVLTDPSKV